MCEYVCFCVWSNWWSICAHVWLYGNICASLIGVCVWGVICAREKQFVLNVCVRFYGWSVLVKCLCVYVHLYAYTCTCRFIDACVCCQLTQRISMESVSSGLLNACRALKGTSDKTRHVRISFICNKQLITLSGRWSHSDRRLHHAHTFCSLSRRLTVLPWFWSSWSLFKTGYLYVVRSTELSSP